MIGTTVEWYDFFLYSFSRRAGLQHGVLLPRRPIRSVGTMLSFATLAVGFIARPLGGLVFGHYGDKSVVRSCSCSACC